MALNTELRARIEQTLAQHKTVLFMKGNRSQPRCGFSAAVVSILDGHGVDYHEIDVLSDPALRDGIKEFGNWPTIPQLYFQGSLIGGSDIIRQLDESGELLSTLGATAAAVAPPSIKLDAGAVSAIKEAGREAEPGQLLRIELKSGGRNIDMYFDNAKSSDLRVEVGGVTVLFDRASARLANGISIEFVDGPNGGFKIDNPNLPAKVKPISSQELKEKLDQRTAGQLNFRLYDVRTDGERAVAAIAGAVAFDDKARAELDQLAKDTMLVFHCHHGMRSQAAAEQVVGKGFRNVYNLRGGIDAWSGEVDPKVPRY
jgi:monothiol glutaredoxin